MGTIKEPVIFKIKQADVKALFAGELDLAFNQGSAFYRNVKNGVPDTDVRTVYAQLLKDQKFLRAARIIAQPDLYVINRIGGSAMGLTEIRLHRKKDEGEWVAVTEEQDENWIISIFENFEGYLKWWMEGFAGKNNEAVVNCIPPLVSLEQLLLILHTVDCFRRVSYKNMLDFKYTQRAHLQLSEFTDTMAASIKSKDIRWLLPAFMTVLPGFNEYQTEFSPENISVLFEHSFLENARLGSENEEVLVFGEAGHMMGVEFYRSWFTSSGFEINTAGLEGFATEERFFIAPTILTNHFIRLQNTDKGRVLANHQAYTFEQLQIKLDELFEAAFTKEVSPVTPSSPVYSPPVTQSPDPAGGQKTAPAELGPKFCYNCGSELSPGAVLCPGCGAERKAL